MRNDKILNSAIIEDATELYPLQDTSISCKNEDSVLKSKENIILCKNKRELFRFKTQPQIDGNLSLGTLFYLQRHVFMIFTDVILVLLLSNSIWTLYSTALSIDISILSYLGVYCPIYFSIIKCFWHLDGKFIQLKYSIIWT